MAHSHYSMVRQKVGIIYAALSHIHPIQTLKILTLKDMYADSQHMITSYKLLYFIKSWKQGIQSNTHGGIDEYSNLLLYALSFHKNHKPVHGWNPGTTRSGN